MASRSGRGMPMPSSRIAARSMSCGDGMPDPGWSTAAAPHASASTSASAPVAAAGQEAGEHGVTGADRAERRNGRRPTVNRALVVDEHGPVGAQARQHGAGALVAQPTGSFDDVGDRPQSLAGHLSELISVRLDEARSGGKDRLEGGAAGVDRDLRPRTGQHADQVGVEAGGRAGGQAPAGNEPICRVDGGLDRVEYRVKLVGAQLGAGLIELRRRPIGLDDRDVGADRSLDLDRHDLDPRLPQQGDEVLALGSADRDDRARRQIVGGKRARDVDALAAGIDPDPQGSHHLATREGLDLDRPVDARIEGERHDHASRTFRPRDRRSSAICASSPESVIRVSISSSAANRERWS